MTAKGDVLQQFEWSVRALAQSATTQRDLYPSYVEVADELALDFEDRCRALSPMTERFPPEVVREIEALDAALEAMSGADHEEMWTMEALEHYPEWHRVRQLARQVLRSMGWSEGPPPKDRAIFVGSDA